MLPATVIFPKLFTWCRELAIAAQENIVTVIKFVKDRQKQDEVPLRVPKTISKRLVCTGATSTEERRELNYRISSVIYQSSGTW